MTETQTIQIIIKKEDLKEKFIKAKTKLMNSVKSDLTQIETLDLLLDNYLDE